MINEAMLRSSFAGVPLDRDVLSLDRTKRSE
jgi:hypothetical protein